MATQSVGIVSGQSINKLTLSINNTGTSAAPNGGVLNINNFTTLTSLTASGIGLTYLLGSTNCPELLFMDISNNIITRPLPDISYNTKITGMLASYSNLNGAMPDISKCKNLITFRCNNNNISGTLPASLSANTVLQNFQVSSNSISGSIPPGMIKDNPNLVTVSINNNSLTGTIPNFGSNGSLVNFYCNNNSLTGTIPSFSSNLRTYQVYNNNFTDFSGTFSNVSKMLFAAQNNRLTVTAVGNILQAAVNSNTQSGTLSIQGGRGAVNNGSVSLATSGTQNLAILSGRNWTVTFNP